MDTTLLSLSPQSRYALPATPRQIAPGDIVVAKLIPASDSRLVVQIGGQRFEGILLESNRSATPILRPNSEQTVSLQVIQTKPQFVAKLVPTPEIRPAAFLKNTALSRLPLQTHLGTALTNLTTAQPDYLASKYGADKPMLKLAVQPALRLREPNGLQTALANSGLFYEQSLARLFARQQFLPPSSDLKFTLLSLLFASPASAGPTKRPINDLSKNLLESLSKISSLTSFDQETIAALTRIETLQLASRAQSDACKTINFFEIPFRQGEEIAAIEGKLERRREPTGTEAKSSAYSITLKIPVSASEKLFANLSWGTNGLQANLWGSSAELREKVANSIDILRVALTEEYGEFISLFMRPIELESSDPERAFGNLIVEDI